MRFVRLQVDHFRCIERASLEFGPGLNVIFGPNELGKSTLVDALRAVLLLPPTSSTAAQYVRWGSADQPFVQLVFQLAEREYWQVNKTFCDGKAALAKSSDGQGFAQKERARAVDGKLRQLVTLGIPEPGGRGGTKGLPSSFLTEVLFPRQDQVTGLFSQSLANDRSADGRKLLAEALEAMAQDPVFKRILDATQAKVDEAFTSKGNFRRGASSPFNAIAENIREAGRQVQQYEGQVDDVSRLEADIRSLTEDRMRIIADRDERKVELEYSQQRLKDAEQRRRCEADLEDARARERDCRDAIRQYEEAAGNVTATTTKLEAARKRLETAAGDLTAAEEAVQSAKDGLRQVEDQDDVQKRELAIARLNERKTQLEDREREARRERDRAQAAAEYLKQSTTVEELQRQVEANDRSMQEATTDQQRLAAIGIYRRHRDLKARIAKMNGAAQAAESLATQAREKRSEADELRATIEATKLPDAETLDRLRRLHRDLEVARRTLQVGLSVEIKPRRRLSLQVTQDDEPAESHPTDQPIRLDAERQIDIDIPDVAEIAVTGGRADARAQADELAAQWNTEGKPILDAGGVTDFGALETACREADMRRRKLKELSDEAHRLETDAQAKRADLDDADSLRQSLGAAEHQLKDLDPAAIESQSDELKRAGATLEVATDDAAQRVDKLDDERRTLAASLAGAKATRTNLRDALEKLCEGDGDVLQRALREHESDLAEADEQLASLESDKADLNEQIDCAQRAGESALDDARQAVVKAQEQLDKAKELAQSEQADVTSLGQALAKWGGKLDDRKKDVETVDLEAAIVATRSAESKLESFAPDTPPVTEKDLHAARHHLEEAEKTVRVMDDRIATARGQLQQVGGPAIRERLASARERLERLSQQEADLHLDYEAWQLLLEKLRESEQNSVAHLGQVLTEPIGEKLRALTNGRYDQLALDQDLKTESVSIGGEERQLDELSVGTADQFSTLLRMTLAEHLGMAIVLDDQLVHSDPQRIEWFREALRAHSGRMQILVFTCRPLDYVTESELPPQGSAMVDRGSIRVIDLAGTLSSRAITGANTRHA